MDFKNNLKNLIKDNNLNNNQLALKLGVSRSLITHYINGTKEPTLQTLEKLKFALNCSYDDLLK
ncbi:MAG: helix-turn-helix transcriptional regulator [Acholeplasmatales bacterium]|nr:helix-turn-helix transcriptional regulator [Acholeplasmatales bacterium]